mmetsp:Transcript_141366/g.451802  ORF Transcript_141366/g.451802 Transcript_141366/m.451802 type:complete len:420 (+) Transcript_141366:518-1777(+)
MAAMRFCMGCPAIEGQPFTTLASFGTALSAREGERGECCKDLSLTGLSNKPIAARVADLSLDGTSLSTSVRSTAAGEEARRPPMGSASGGPAPKATDRPRRLPPPRPSPAEGATPLSPNSCSSRMPALRRSSSAARRCRRSASEQRLSPVAALWSSAQCRCQELRRRSSSRREASADLCLAFISSCIERCFANASWAEWRALLVRSHCAVILSSCRSRTSSSSLQMQQWGQGTGSTCSVSPAGLNGSASPLSEFKSSRFACSTGSSKNSQDMLPAPCCLPSDLCFRSSRCSNSPRNSEHATSISALPTFQDAPVASSAAAFAVDAASCRARSSASPFPSRAAKEPACAPMPRCTARNSLCRSSKHCSSCERLASVCFCMPECCQSVMYAVSCRFKLRISASLTKHRLFQRFAMNLRCSS